MELLSSPSGNNMGGVYTSPYQISVNGVPTLLVCDDFTTDINFGHTWNAIEYDITQVTGTGPQKFQHTPNPVTYPGQPTPVDYTIQQQYDAVAWLAEQLLDGSILDTSYAAAIYSYAIWQIFDSTAIDGYNGDALNAQEQSDVKSAMSAAFSATHLDYEIYIYTPDPFDSSQEFLGIGSHLPTPYDFPNTPVPEGSTLALLGFDLLSALAGIFLVRRYRVRA
jgi:hypothetical protein